MIEEQKKENYTKTWESAADFPTYEADEETVRSDMQYLYEEIRVWLNDVIDHITAPLIPFTMSAGIPYENVQDAIDDLKRQLDEAVMHGIVPDLSITSIKLADGAVIETKLADGSVTTPKLADGAVNGTKLADGSVADRHLASESISGLKITKNTIPANRLEDLTITTNKLSNGCINADKLLNNSIGKNKFTAQLRAELGI